MKGLGTILAIIGVLVVILAAVNHFVKNFMGSASHMSLIIGVVGVVLLVIGVVMSMRPAKA
jgi:protein-S-isoprenylcysteine O-methyltransferase Ste14